MGRLTALVAIGALVALSGCSGASSPSPTPAPTLGPDRPPSAGPTGGGPSTPPASGGPGAVFAALPEFPAEGAYEITGATSTASGLLAVGYGPQAGEDFFGLRQGIAWRSTDGVTWEANPAPELAGVTPALVASIGSVDYLAGLLSACPQFSEEECEELPDAGYSIWRSTEGGEWEVLPQLPAMQQAISLDEMVALGDSLVVSGSAGDDGETATVWMSPDGVEWAETTDLAGLDPISALAAGDAGLVAFGTHFSADQENVLVRAASSADGVSFSPASVPELTNASIDSAAAGSGGFVGVGYGETEDLLLTGTALYSADGLSWVQSSASDGSLAASAVVAAHGLPDGFVALGFTPHADDLSTQDGHSWISADGRTWKTLAPFGDSFSLLTASALGSAGLVVFTVNQEETEEAVTSTVGAWFAPISALVP